MNPLLIKWAVIAAAALALAGTAGYGGWRLQSGRIAEKDAQIGRMAEKMKDLLAAQKRADAAIKVAEREREAARQRERAARDALADALLQNPDWASQPVPEEVQRALRP